MNRDFMGALRERVLVFDGAMGTMLQNAGLSLDDYQGKEGCSEILCVSRPDVVRDIHAAYFEAGADAVETNSFGSSAIVLAEYDIADQVVPLNRLAAELAREVADGFQADGRPRWVAGSIGPGTKLPTLGHTTYDVLLATYANQAFGLLEGGADLLLIETCQDLLQIKAAVAGGFQGMRRAGRRVPLITQVTVETTGQMLLGSDIAAALTAIEPTTQRGRPSAWKPSATSRASSAARWFSGTTWSAMSYSASTTAEDPNELVSTASAPASK
jgi:5-methyltetrahydrofolate--homocysteine methyltransferase